ncbi:alpha/beta hydrolase [Vibrio fluminensis]|uniref:alpha/beta hydrolase n=1 Tax=Vibrio fluminensis TaxID=2783614 RepID=UPI001886BA07|nr:alpha/beta hydrolase [Vibrio fluminensis]
MFQETHYQLLDTRLAAREIGHANQTGLTVVYLHGWLDNAASFETVMLELHQLAPHIHQCAIDLPGHGLSEHKCDGNYYPFHDYIDDLYQFLLNLSPNKLVLVGHSLGALIASCYSAAFPEQVSALVQIEGNGPLAESSEKTVQRLRDGVIKRRRVRHKPAREFASIDEIIERRASVNHVTAEQIAPIVWRGGEVSPKGWRLRHDIKLQSDSLYRMSFQHAEQIRQQIECPNWLILGEQGYPHLTQDSDNLANVAYIAGGHHCHLQQPALTAQQIFALVNKI